MAGMGMVIKGSARFGLQGRSPSRIVAKWSPDEVEKLRKAVLDLLNLDETCELFPARSYHAVKCKYYPIRAEYDVIPINCRQRNKRLDPSGFNEMRFQKDAREGSAKLLQALIDAGLYVPPEMKKAG
jgi:hypothetical protein